MLPRYIALCGNPKSGKSEIQRILHEQFAVVPVDDGEVLREFAINYLNIPVEDVYTQEGKARTTEILGKSWVNRDILGTLGKHLEDMFGEHIMPFIATRNLSPGRSFSFGSVRKTQGAFYKENGGVVIKVVRPGADPSGFAFDKFDESLVDHVIENDGSIEDLERKVVDLFNRLGA